VRTGEEPGKSAITGGKCSISEVKQSNTQRLSPHPGAARPCRLPAAGVWVGALGGAPPQPRRAQEEQAPQRSAGLVLRED